MTFSEFLGGFKVNQRLQNKTKIVVIDIVVSKKYQLYKRGAFAQSNIAPLHSLELVTKIHRSGLRLYIIPNGYPTPNFLDIKENTPILSVYISMNSTNLYICVILPII